MRAVHGEEDLQCLPRLCRAWQALQSGQGWAPGCRLAQPDAGFRTVQDFLAAIEKAISEGLPPCACRGHGSAGPCHQPLREGLFAGCNAFPNVRLSCMPLRRSLGPGWHESKYPELVLAVRAGELPLVESAHRLVAFMTGPSEPNQHMAPYALHKPCCPARCVNPLHLRWGSALDKGRDRARKVEWVQSCHGLWKAGSGSRVVEKVQERASTRLRNRLGQGKKRRSATTVMLLEAKPVVEGKRQPKPTMKSCTCGVA